MLMWVFFSQQGNVKKIQKIGKNSYYCKRKFSYFLNQLRNFNEIFRKIWLMIILSHKKPGFHLFPEKHVLGKTTGSQIDHSPVFRVKRWSKFHILRNTTMIKNMIIFPLFQSLFIWKIRKIKKDKIVEKNV